MKFEIEPIGWVHCEGRYRFEAPRQGVFAENRGVIELEPGCQYEQAAADLKGFSRIWVIFVFHLNQTWNVKVTPPVAPPGRRIGVLATRSPHRPNRLGMSCVELERVEGRRIYIRNFDMLDLTPVVDVKPYIPAADSFPGAEVGWLAEAEANRHEVEIEPGMRGKSEFVVGQGGPDLVNFCQVQLVNSPLDGSRKRLTELGDGGWEIGCRTWRVRFEVEEGAKRVRVVDVRSNYRAEELELGAEDRYGDLEIHRRFVEKYG